MAVSLDTVEMTTDELRLCRECVRKMAYEYWLEAGRPEGQGDAFWLQAERDWLSRNYVPHRDFDGTRPQ